MSLPEPLSCPHCHEPYTEKVHLCADAAGWTREEKDAWRTVARVRWPSVIFVKVG